MRPMLPHFDRNKNEHFLIHIVQHLSFGDLVKTSKRREFPNRETVSIPPRKWWVRDVLAYSGANPDRFLHIHHASDGFVMF
jgi:hypothetical protein